jgi:hypothetical protein
MLDKHFKLENKRQKLVPLPSFLKRLGRYAAFSLGLIVFSTGIGAIGCYIYFK